MVDFEEPVFFKELITAIYAVPFFTPTRINCKEDMILDFHLNSLKITV